MRGPAPERQGTLIILEVSYMYAISTYLHDAGADDDDETFKRLPPFLHIAISRWAISQSHADARLE
jgi:hypothetical protein